MTLHRIPALLALPLALMACVPPEPTGRQDFDALCSSCHGAGGKGDGEMAALLDRRPADLTRLASGNKGVFPATRVMGKIWGYAKPDGHVMPEFSPLLDGETVPFDGGDGIATPTPVRLVQLAQYVESLQE